MVKKAKKRGVKPGTKRGKYKTFKITATSRGLKVGDTINLEPGPAIGAFPTLCGQLEDAISNLETRISNSIAKINSLM